MSRRSRLPQRLFRQAFVVTSAGGAGLTPKRLRGEDVDRPFHGVRSIGLDLTTVLGRCRAYAPRLRPGEAFSHVTAAQLYGVPLPRPDLAYPELKIAIEYEGDEHRSDLRRWRDDIDRRRGLEAAGWAVLRVTADDLRDPSRFLADPSGQTLPQPEPKLGEICPLD